MMSTKICEDTPPANGALNQDANLVRVRRRPIVSCDSWWINENKTAQEVRWGASKGELNVPPFYMGHCLLGERGTP